MCVETVWIYWIRFKFFVRIPPKILSECDKSKEEFLHLHTTEEILKHNKRQNDPIALFPITPQTHIHKIKQLTTNKICCLEFNCWWHLEYCLPWTICLCTHVWGCFQWEVQGNGSRPHAGIEILMMSSSSRRSSSSGLTATEHLRQLKYHR